MSNLYNIESRYQYNTRTGIEWTKWFCMLSEGPNEDKSFLEKKISEYKDNDKKTKSKLKHEYRVVDYVEPEEVHAFQKMYTRRKNKNNNKNTKKSPGTTKKS